jgi:hypothetical protein
MDDSPTAAINQNLIGVLPLLILSQASCAKADAEPADWPASDALGSKCFQQPLDQNGWLA